MSISSPSTQQGEIYQNFIGGEWRNSRGSETFTSTNPAHTSEIIGRYQRSTAADIEDAVEAAVKAQPGWAAIPAPERGEILLRSGVALRTTERRACCSDDTRNGQDFEGNTG